MRKLELGVKAKDKITGFEGIVIGKTEWLTGCDQVILKAPVKKDGTVSSGEWVDVGVAEVTGDGILPKEVQDEKPGGPRKDRPSKNR